MERRIVEAGLTTRAAGDGPGARMLVGYAAKFNSLSQVLWDFREQIAPGAFAESLTGDVRALWNHDTAYVLGRTTAGTLRLAEDDTGLAVEIDPPDTPLVQSFLVSVERGDVTQMSFGFVTLEDKWDLDEQNQLVRTLLKVKLYEVSPVTFPAYTETEIGLASVRSEWAEQVRAIYGDKPLIPDGVRQGPQAAGLQDAGWDETQGQLELLRRMTELALATS